MFLVDLPFLVVCSCVLSPRFNNYTIAPQQNRYRDGHHITQNTAIYDTDYTELHGITQIMTRIYFS
ncbi:hypothetical protein VPHK367G1_0021 [Vibrio phage K367 g1]